MPSPSSHSLFFSSIQFGTIGKSVKAKHYSSFRREVEETLKLLKRNHIQVGSKEFEVTVGVTPSEEGFSWDYQTGDNSFSGGAYCHLHWVCLYLTSRSNCKELSKDAVEQLRELLAQGD